MDEESIVRGCRRGGGMLVRHGMDGSQLCTAAARLRDVCARELDGKSDGMSDSQQGEQGGSHA